LSAIIGIIPGMVVRVDGKDGFIVASFLFFRIYIAMVPFFLVLFGSKFWIPKQKMARKNVSENQNGEGGGKWEW
jgi:hypothetical protein